MTNRGKSKQGLSKRGLGPKGADWAKKGPFGGISALPPWLWGEEELVPIGPEKAPIGKGPIFQRGVPLDFLCKPPFVSPRLDIHKSGERKRHKHKFLGPIFLWTFLTLMPGCPGVKKFLPTTGAAGKGTFWCGRPPFLDSWCGCP